MLARTHRFHGRNSLRVVYEHGQTVRSPHLALRFRSNPGRSSYRVAVVVSKKVHKSAVARNRIRRRIYEIIRIELPADTPPVDIVLTVFSDQLATWPPDKLQSEVKRLLDNIKTVPKTTT